MSVYLDERMTVVTFHSGDTVANFSYYRIGDIACITGLNGKNFYSYIKPLAAKLMKERGINHMLAEVEAWHFKLLKRTFPDFKITARGKRQLAGKEFLLVEISNGNHGSSSKDNTSESAKSK